MATIQQPSKSEDIYIFVNLQKFPGARDKILSQHKKICVYGYVPFEKSELYENESNTILVPDVFSSRDVDVFMAMDISQKIGSTLIFSRYDKRQGHLIVLTSSRNIGRGINIWLNNQKNMSTMTNYEVHSVLNTDEMIEVLNKLLYIKV